METLKTKIDVDIKSAIRAKHDRLIIIRDDKPAMTETGLDIAHAKEKPNTGVVLSTGNTVLQAKAGMHVAFGRNKGTELMINEHKLLLLHEYDVMLDLTTRLPFKDRVLVRPDPKLTQINGIIIPDNVNEQPQSGVVISVGPMCVETKIGEHVLFGKFAGLHIEIEKEGLLVIREADLFAMV